MIASRYMSFHRSWRPSTVHVPPSQRSYCVLECSPVILPPCLSTFIRLSSVWPCTVLCALLYRPSLSEGQWTLAENGTWTVWERLGNVRGGGALAVSTAHCGHCAPVCVRIPTVHRLERSQNAHRAFSQERHTFVTSQKLPATVCVLRRPLTSTNEL